jgi:hypothetical protein
MVSATCVFLGRPSEGAEHPFAEALDDELCSDGVDLLNVLEFMGVVIVQ